MTLQKFKCTVMRGGTSKGIFLDKNILPADDRARDQVILKIFGSPDIRQIDGLGGAEPLTSKLAIIAPPSIADADVDYTFGQVSIQEPYIDYSGNCGNISSAVGPYAIDEGIVTPVQPITTVRIHNTNTGKILIAEVPVECDKAKVEGDYAIDGVPGTAAKIMMDFAATAGTLGLGVLPTGKPIDLFNLPEFGKYEVSIVDAANPMVFVRAKDVGLRGTEGPAEIDSNRKLLALLECIRTATAVKTGMVSSQDEATAKSPAFPMIAVVSPAAGYTAFGSGVSIEAEQVSFVSRLIYMGILHKTYAATGTTCTGVAAKIPGTIVNEVLKETGDKITIGHPSGVIEVEAIVKNSSREPTVYRAAFGRTARRIMDGFVYVRHGV
jgi:2-methylaconitate cis-trans-isomerase PrpF